eukprot:15365948-Ditylum_brightwellii.AAC.1
MPLDMPQPKWLADPTHQTKRGKIKEIIEVVKAPVEHLFDKHNFCGAWCKHKTLTLEQKEKQQQYCSDVNKDATLYKQLTNTMVEFSTDEPLLESCHPFDTQPNEAMNTLVMKHAPRIKCIVWGYEKFWRAVYGEFGIDIGNGMEKYCAPWTSRAQSIKITKKTYNKLKRAKANMEKMKIECAKAKKDQEDGHGYGDDKGCNLSDEIISTCVCPGCPGKKNHKTAKS